MKGRKRHIAVDTLGLVMAVQVHPANVQDNVGAVGVLAHLKHYERLTTIRADGAYRGMVTAYARAHGWALEVIRRQGGPFQVLPKRWVVERTFAWLGRWRRLSKDYEGTCQSSRAWVLIAMTGLMLRRLTP